MSFHQKKFMQHIYTMLFVLSMPYQNDMYRYVNCMLKSFLFEQIGKINRDNIKCTLSDLLA